MNHEIYEALISAQLDGELSPEEEARLEAHLAACPQCRAAKAELEAVHQLLLNDSALPPPGLTERIMAGLPTQPKKKAVPWARRIAPLAAAAVVALVVIGVVKPSFNGGAPQEEYAMAAESAVEEAEEAEEAAPETPMETEPMAEENGAPEAVTAGDAVQHTQTAPALPPQSSQQPDSQKPAAPPASASFDAREEAAPQAAAGEPQDAEEEGLPIESASEESPELAVTTTEEEPAPESAEPDELPAEGGGAEDEAIVDTQPSSTLTWQQARDRLCEYLGRVPGDLTAQDMSPDGESWLFTAEGVRYAVDRYSGAVTTLSGKE